MPAGPIGSVWASGAWSNTAWEANTWAAAVIPAIVETFLGVHLVQVRGAAPALARLTQATAAIRARSSGTPGIRHEEGQ